MLMAAHGRSHPSAGWGRAGLEESGFRLAAGAGL